MVDVNDNNPDFIDLPYVFRIKENEPSGYVGRVHAKDGDQDHNGIVTYSIAQDSLFTIDDQTGEIRSKQPLDYERDQVIKWLLFFIPGLSLCNLKGL